MINVVQNRRHLVPSIVAALLLCGGILHSSGKAADAPQLPDTYPLSDVVIRLERQSCWGSCPNYTVEVHGDGRVVYEGRSHVAVVGRKEKKIDQERVGELLKRIYKIGFFQMQSSYASSKGISVENGMVRELTIISSDVSARIITVKIGAYEKQVADYVFAPSDLVALSPAIDEAAEIENWLR